MQIAFIGLGRMGGPIARRLIERHSLALYPLSLAGKPWPCDNRWLGWKDKTFFSLRASSLTHRLRKSQQRRPAGD